MAKIARAREFAIKAHKKQLYGKQPYVVHLDAVVKVLIRFGVSNEDLLTAGYLHDTIEDTATTIQELESTFGNVVASLVDAVTDGFGRNRKEKKERPYKLIPTVPGALVLKLADRIANVEAAKRQGNFGLLNMYAKEQLEFRRRLFDPAHKTMFNHIEKELNT